MQAKAGMSRALWEAIAGLAPPVSDPPLPGMVPPAPPLGGNVDPSKIEEIRRTVYVGNLNTQVVKPFFLFLSEVFLVSLLLSLCVCLSFLICC